MELKQIYKSLQNVQEHMLNNPIAKAGENKFQKYKYRGIDQIIQAFAQPLADNNILTVTQPELKVSTKHLDDKTTITRVAGTLRFISTKDGSYVDRSYVGHSKSNQGKDLEAARSFAYRNALLETFCVPFEQVEPELEGVDPTQPSDEVADGSDTLMDDYIKDLNACKNLDEAKKVYQEYEKETKLTCDPDQATKLILEFTKLATAKKESLQND
jgi:hypothetical protein